MPPHPPSLCVLCTHTAWKYNANGLSTFYLLPTPLYSYYFSRKMEPVSYSILFTLKFMHGLPYYYNLATVEMPVSQVSSFGIDSSSMHIHMPATTSYGWYGTAVVQV